MMGLVSSFEEKEIEGRYVEGKGRERGVEGKRKGCER